MAQSKKVNNWHRIMMVLGGLFILYLVGPHIVVPIIMMLAPRGENALYYFIFVGYYGSWAFGIVCLVGIAWVFYWLGKNAKK